MKLEEINKLTISTYEELALKYHNSFKDEMDQKIYDRNILDKFSKGLKPNSEVCDAGCGPSGHIGKYLQKKGFKITGIDISPKCVEIATEYEKEIEFHCMDMMNTNFEKDKFNGIISYYSIIHTPKIESPRIFCEFNRILKLNGKLLLVTKKGNNEGIVEDDWYEGNKIYFTNYLERDLEDYINKSGLEIEFQETRKPYNSEIDVERIYVIAKKIKNCT